MGVYETIVRRRTIRRFENKPVSYQALERCVNAARLAPSAANLQPCEYLIIDEENLLDKVFATLKWAGYITDGRPVELEVPRATTKSITYLGGIFKFFLNAFLSIAPKQQEPIPSSRAVKVIFSAAKPTSCWYPSVLTSLLIRIII